MRGRLLDGVLDFLSPIYVPLRYDVHATQDHSSAECDVSDSILSISRDSWPLIFYRLRGFALDLMRGISAYKRPSVPSFAPYLITT